jgi:hypothetical protein
LSLERIPQPDYANHPAYGRYFADLKWKDRADALGALLPQLKKVSFDYLRWQYQKRKLAGAALPMAAKPELLQELLEKGAIGVRLAAEDKAFFVDKTRPWLESLLEKRAGLEKRRFRDNSIRLESPELVAQADARLRKAGWIAIAENYMGVPLRVRRIYALVFGTGDTSFWKKKFEGASVTVPETTYLHIDSTFGTFKFLVYLNEVTEENGPFCYVQGSHRFSRAPGELIIRKAMDRSSLDSVSLANRRKFYALPRFLQRKCAVGYDYLDEQPESRELLARERRFLSTDGDMILFDYDGLHRGGMVRSGERQILQIQLEPALPERGNA